MNAESAIVRESGLRAPKIRYSDAEVMALMRRSRRHYQMWMANSGPNEVVPLNPDSGSL